MNGLALVNVGVKMLTMTHIIVGAPSFSEMSGRFAGVVAGVLSSVGIILCLWGGFNFAMSLEARDNNQRIQGAITFFSGILLLVLPQLVTYISGVSVTAVTDFGG